MLSELEQYKCPLDDIDHKMIDHKVVELGIEKYLTRQLIYLDCTRIYNDGSRAMQTIGYPYQREISSYLYALEKYLKEEEDKYDYYSVVLMDRHFANLEYEKENLPIWYGGKKAKDKWDKNHCKHPRRKNMVEQTIDCMGKKLSNTERLKRLSAQFGNLTFNIKRK